jgi:integrase
VKNGSLYASLTVPKALRASIGKRKYQKLLETSSPNKAQIEANFLVKIWKKEIEIHQEAISKSISSPLLALFLEALEFKKELKSESQDEEAITALELYLLDKLENLETSQGLQVAEDFANIAYGRSTPLLPFYEEWISKLEADSYQAKTIDTYARDAKLFIDHFGTVDKVTNTSIGHWMMALTDGGMSSNTFGNRVVKGVRSFWGYLKERKHISKEQFNLLLDLAPKEKKTKVALSKVGWVAFTPEEAQQALTAITAKDEQLNAVVLIAMYTGMRIKEICSLKVIDLKLVEGVQCFEITNAKTLAGDRVVPIHTKLIPLIDKLLLTAKGDHAEIPDNTYLIPGLTFNKYADRSNAVGKRFGRLKTSLGFNSKKVFHSIRSCVVTQLDRSEFRETSIAKLVGHENPNVTIKRYSQGQDIPELVRMIKSLSYPTGIQ